MAGRGDVYHGPNGEIYRIRKGMKPLHVIAAGDVEGLAGTPQPKANDPIPEWLVPFLTQGE